MHGYIGVDESGRYINHYGELVSSDEEAVFDNEHDLINKIQELERDPVNHSIVFEIKKIYKLECYD